MRSRSGCTAASVHLTAMWAWVIGRGKGRSGGVARENIVCPLKREREDYGKREKRAVERERGEVIGWVERVFK